MTIHAYLTFNGNCKEAMKFYQKCLGGELRFQTLGESPLSEKMPTKMKKCILQATLSSRHFLLMGSDLVSEEGLLKGNGVSLVLNCESEKDIRTQYIKLSQGGEQLQPLKKTSWNKLFGTIKDRYGFYWMLNLLNKEI